MSIKGADAWLSSPSRESDIACLAWDRGAVILEVSHPLG